MELNDIQSILKSFDELFMYYELFYHSYKDELILALTFDSLPDQGSFPKALNPGLKELL
jgi:hypothetical protein